MKARRKNHFFVIVLAFTLLLAACSDNNGTEKENGDAKTDGTKESGGKTEQVLNLSGTADFTSLDIHHASDAPSFDALYQIGAGFMTFDKDGSFIPDLASEEPTANDDLTVYTFTIRDDAKWSNDEPVTANDFVYSWKRAVNPDTASEYSFIYESASIFIESPFAWNNITCRFCSIFQQ